MHVTLTCAKWTCPPTADGVSFGKQVRIISGECRSVSNGEMVVSVLKTSIDNCDARIKNRIRSSNSRARSGNDPVRIVNNRDAFGNTRLRGGNNDLQDGINHSHSANNCSRRENNHFVSLVDSLLIQWYLMFAANIRFRWELSTFVAETIMLEPRILADVPSISVLQMEMIGSAATAIMDVLPVIISVAENIASLTT